MTVESTGESRRPGRPRNETYDDAILDATMAILAESGYAGLTIDGVAARARLGRPTIYRRWASKPELVVAALSRNAGLPPALDTGSLRGDLIAVQEHQVTVMNADGFRRISPGLLADLTADPDLAATYLSDYIAPRRQSVREALQRGIDRGELEPDTDFAFVSDLLTGPLFFRVLVRGERLRRKDAERTVDVVLAAYGTPARSAPASGVAREVETRDGRT
jgi:AcrR family transcriptional regulator